MPDSIVTARQPANPFDVESLKAEVQKALSAAPPNKKTAIIASIVGGTLEVRAAARIKDTWEIGAVFRKVPGMPVEQGGYVAIRF